jgi:hypothetical protein
VQPERLSDRWHALAALVTLSGLSRSVLPDENRLTSENPLAEENTTKKVYLFEEKCCGVSIAKPLETFLRDELGDQVDVRTFDLSHPQDLVPLPPVLFFKLMAEGSKCLPAMTVDSVVVTEGWLPNVGEVLNLVATGEPTTRPDLSCCCDSSVCC